MQWMITALPASRSPGMVGVAWGTRSLSLTGRRAIAPRAVVSAGPMITPGPSPIPRPDIPSGGSASRRSVTLTASETGRPVWGRPLKLLLHQGRQVGGTRPFVLWCIGAELMQRVMQTARSNGSASAPRARASTSSEPGLRTSIGKKAKRSYGNSTASDPIRACVCARARAGHGLGWR